MSLSVRRTVPGQLSAAASLTLLSATVGVGGPNGGRFFHKQEKVTENGGSDAIFCGEMERKGLDKQGKFAIMQVSGQSRARPAFRRFVPPDKTMGGAEI